MKRSFLMTIGSIMLLLWVAFPAFTMAQDIQQARTTQSKDERVYFQQARTNQSKDERVYDVVEQMPQFPGGPKAMYNFLKENVRYPEEDRINGISSRTVVTFVVDTDGNISDVTITKSVSETIDKESIRLVYSMPKWIPGQHKGKKVKVRYHVPVTIKLGTHVGQNGRPTSIKGRDTRTNHLGYFEHPDLLSLPAVPFSFRCRTL